jgi:hypothetical protein
MVLTARRDEGEPGRQHVLPHSGRRISYDRVDEARVTIYAQEAGFIMSAALRTVGLLLVLMDLNVSGDAGRSGWGTQAPRA